MYTMIVEWWPFVYFWWNFLQTNYWNHKNLQTSISWINEQYSTNSYYNEWINKWIFTKNIFQKIWIELFNPIAFPICNINNSTEWKIFESHEISFFTWSWRQDVNWDWINDLYITNSQTWKIEWYVHKKEIWSLHVFEFDNSFDNWWLKNNDNFINEWWEIIKSSNSDWTINVILYWQNWNQVLTLKNIHWYEFIDINKDWNKELIAYENYELNWTEFKKLHFYVFENWKYVKKLQLNSLWYKLFDLTWNNIDEIFNNSLDWKTKLYSFIDNEFILNENDFWEIELRDLNKDWIKEIISKNKLNWTELYKFDFYSNNWWQLNKLSWSWLIWYQIDYDSFWDINWDWYNDIIVRKWWLWKALYTKNWENWFWFHNINWIPFIQMWSSWIFKINRAFFWIDWKNNLYFINFKKNSNQPEVLDWKNMYWFDYKFWFIYSLFSNITFENWYSKLSRLNSSNSWVYFIWTNSIKETWIVFNNYENRNQIIMDFEWTTYKNTKTNDYFWFELSNWNFWMYINWNIFISKSDTNKYIEWWEIKWQRRPTSWWSEFYWIENKFPIIAKINNDWEYSWLYLIYVQKEKHDFLNSFITTHNFYWDIRHQSWTYSSASIWWTKIFNIKNWKFILPEDWLNNLLYISPNTDNRRNYRAPQSIINKFIVNDKRCWTISWLFQHESQNRKPEFKTFCYTWLNRYINSSLNFDQTHIWQNEKTLFFDYLNWKI